jgi:nucleotide-binding universal stress UspA family protein
MASEDRDLTDSMGLFEAAVYAKPVDVTLPPLETVVLVLDGSNQDATARGLAKCLARATGAMVHEQASLSDAAEILRACTERKAHLLVLPVPFGRDVESLRDESLGSVVDMILQESPCPVLCIRQPVAEEHLQALCADVLIPILDHGADHGKAMGWAFRVLPKGGKLLLLGVADRELLAEAKQLLGDAISPEALRSEALNRAVTADIGGLAAAAQKQGLALGDAVRVEVRVGRSVPVALEVINAQPRLTIVPGSRDHTSIAYHHAVDLILGAAGPVLVAL